MFAAMNGHQSAAKVLLEAGGDVKIRSEGGLTALDAAQMKNHSDLVDLLKKYGV